MKIKYNIVARIIAGIIILSFLAQDAVWANPDALQIQLRTAADSFKGPFTEVYGVKSRQKRRSPPLPINTSKIKDAESAFNYVSKLLEKGKNIIGDSRLYEREFLRPLFELFLLKIEADFIDPNGFVESCRDILKEQDAYRLRGRMNEESSDLLAAFKKMEYKEADAEDRSINNSIGMYGVLLFYLANQPKPYMKNIYKKLMALYPVESLALTRRGISYRTRGDSVVHVYDKNLLFEGAEAIYMKNLSVNAEEKKPVDVRSVPGSNASVVLRMLNIWRRHIEEHVFRSEEQRAAMKEELRSFERYTTVVELSNIDTFLIFSDPEHNVVRPIHVGRERRVFYASKRFFSEIGKLDDEQLKKFVLLFARNQRFLDIYHEMKSSGYKPQMVQKALFDFTMSFFERDDTYLAHPDELKESLFDFMRRDTAIKYKEVFNNAIREADEARLLEQYLKASGDDADIERFEDLRRKYDYLLCVYEGLGLRSKASAAYKKLTAVTKAIQDRDGGRRPFDHQVALVFTALRFERWQDFMLELKKLLTGTGYPRKIKRSEIGICRDAIIKRASLQEVHTFENDLRHALYAQKEAATPETIHVIEFVEKETNRLLKDYFADPFGGLTPSDIANDGVMLPKRDIEFFETEDTRSGYRTISVFPDGVIKTSGNEKHIQPIEVITNKSLPSGEQILVVLDIHGTLLEPTWKEEWIRVYREVTGTNPPSDWIEKHVFNKSDEDIINNIAEISLESRNLVKQKADAIRKKMREEEMPKAMTGALEFLKELSLRGVPVVLASNTFWSKDVVLKQLRASGLMNYIKEENILCRESEGDKTFDKIDKMQMFRDKHYSGHAVAYFDDRFEGMVKIGGQDILVFGIPQGDGEEFEYNRGQLIAGGADYILHGWRAWRTIIEGVLNIPPAITEYSERMSHIPLAKESNFKGIVFDCGNVISRYDYRIPAKKFAEYFKIDEESIYKFFEERNTDPRNPLWKYEHGLIDEEGLFRGVVEWCERQEGAIKGKSLTRKEFDSMFMSLWLGDITETVAFMKALKYQGYHIYILSTTAAIHYKWFWHYSAAAEFMDEKDFYASHLRKFSKPDKRSYLEVVDRGGFKAAEYLFIDDRQDNVDGALEAGLGAAIKFNPDTPKTSIDEIIKLLRVKSVMKNRFEKIKDLPVKAAIFDVDGNLTNEKDEIDPEAIRRLLFIRSLGIPVIISTARTYELDAKSKANGGHDAKEVLLAIHRYIPAAMREEVLKGLYLATENNLSVSNGFLRGEDGWVDYTQKLFELLGIKLDIERERRLKDFLIGLDPEKLGLSCEWVEEKERAITFVNRNSDRKEQLTKIREVLQRLLKESGLWDDKIIISQADVAVEVSLCNISKAANFVFLSEILGVKDDDRTIIVSSGDKGARSGTDNPMLAGRKAGLSSNEFDPDDPEMIALTLISGKAKGIPSVLWALDQFKYKDRKGRIVTMPPVENFTALHKLFGEAEINKDARVLLSENLFIKEDGDRSELDEVIVALRPLLDSGKVAILSPMDIRRNATNRREGRDRLAAVFTREDFENKTLWNGLDKENSLKSSVIILDDRLTGDNYLYFEGVIGLAHAIMANNKFTINAYYNLLSGIGLDDSVLKLLDSDSGNNMAFALKAMLRFRPVEKIDADLFNGYRIKMEKFLISA